MQQKEAFLQELQNQIVGKSNQTSPLAAQASSPIPQSPLLSFLPYLQHPYVPLPPPSDAPWNLQQSMIKDEHEKKTDGNLDTPLNLTKPKSSCEDKNQILHRHFPNDGNNNNKNKNHCHDHAGTSKHSQRLPYNMSNDDPDFFAACRLWPVMAAAAVQHNVSPQSQSLPVSMMQHTTAPRENVMLNDSNFIGMSEKQKRDGMLNEDKVRIVRQQGGSAGRHRNNSERDLIGKKLEFF